MLLWGDWPRSFMQGQMTFSCTLCLEGAFGDDNVVCTVQVGACVHPPGGRCRDSVCPSCSQLSSRRCRCQRVRPCGRPGPGRHMAPLAGRARPLRAEHQQYGPRLDCTPSAVLASGELPVPTPCSALGGEHAVTDTPRWCAAWGRCGRPTPSSSRACTPSSTTFRSSVCPDRVHRHGSRRTRRPSSVTSAVGPVDANVHGDHPPGERASQPPRLLRGLHVSGASPQGTVVPAPDRNRSLSPQFPTDLTRLVYASLANGLC